MNNNLIDNRHIRVFISSTFQDMQGERDYLMKHAFPMLRKRASARDVTLTEIDLRWGITEEESQSGKVVEICLREIENSIPFFIGIIGNRYGWVPKKKDIGENVTRRYPKVKNYVKRKLSVTDMEMQFGVLERKENIHAYFYIKKEETGKDIDNPVMLEKLKKEVRNSRYPSSSYSTPEELAQQVEQAFVSLLDKLFPVGNITELEKERIGQRSFMNQLCLNYIKEERNFEVLDNWLNDKESRQLVVTGASGMGKSALIANWTKKKLNDNKREYSIVYHFTGNGGSECSHEHIKKTLCDEIENIYGWDKIDDEGLSKMNDLSSGTQSEKDDKLDRLFVRIASEADKPLLIVLDAVNQILDIDNAKLLNWLPVPPRKVKILFSTLENDRTMQVFRNRNYPIFTLQPLRSEQRKQLIVSYLKRLYGKNLNEVLVEKIASDKQCENTLVLKTLLDELINYGIYEKLGERVEYYLSKDTVEEFYQALLNSYEEEFGKDIVGHTLALIAVSKSGLSEDEILAILNDGCDKDKPRVPRLYWSQFLCAFMAHTTTKGGIITFSHSYILNAVEERYLKSDNNHERTCREEIMRLMEGQETDWALVETVWQIFKLNDTKRLHSSLVDIRVFNVLYLYNAYELGLYWRKLMSKGYALADYKNLLAKADKDFCDKLCYFCHYIMADYDIALFISQHALKMSLGLLGEENKETAISFNNIGSLYEAKGNYSKALEYYHKSLEIRVKIFGEEHHDTTTSYNNIGLVYECLGDYHKSLEYLDKALKIREKLYAEDHVAIALSYDNLGGVYMRFCDYDKALVYRLKALEIFEKHLGNGHLDTATCYNNLGSVYIGKGNYFKALEYYQKSLEIREDILGYEHPDNATNYNNIGVVYDILGDYPLALKYYQKGLKIREKIFGASHPSIALSYSNIGYLYYHINDHSKALKYYQMALEIDEKIIGKKYDEIINIWNKIGLLYQKTNKWNKALEYHNKALDLSEKYFGKEHLATASCNESIGIIYRNIAEYSKALDYQKQALDVRIRILGEEHLDTAKSYNNIGVVYERLDDCTKALECYLKSIEIRNNILGEKHSDTARIYHNIGIIYDHIGDYTKALEFHKKALEIRREVLTADDYDIENSQYYIEETLKRINENLPENRLSKATEYYNIGTVFVHLGDYPKALEHFEKALEIRRAILPADDPAIQQLIDNIEETKNLVRDEQQ